MQVTVSLLPVSLSLVHVPRSRLPHLSHPILRRILYPSPNFLNITCNEIELSLFAEHHLLKDFEEIARKDSQKQRSRSGSSSKRKDPNAYEAIEISYEKWSVLQIDSHSDRIDSSGARVHELSAPLAAAGISILYQSSYMSDFIFVKEYRLQEVMDLFASAGFNLYSSDSSLLTTRSTSPSLSPTSDDWSSLHDFTPLPSHNSKTVLTRSRSGTDTSSALSQSCRDMPKEPLSPESASLRNKARSPTSGEVRVLHPDLACVGLSDEFGIDHWGLKIVKLVAFPDLIPLPPQHSSPPRSSRHSLFEQILPVSVSQGRPRPRTPSSSSSSTSEDDGYFSHSPQNVSVTSLDSSASRSYTDLPSLITPSPFKPPSKHLLSPLSPGKPLPMRSRPTLTHSPTSSNDNEVLFFSFTRTPEGSSLTADVHVLAALFPPHERHMVICSGELDAADAFIDTTDSSDEDDSGDCDTPSSLKCLQLDLRRFGLDKHGLVNRFSRVLEENGINHMYSSTFKTANLLVDKKHATRAQSLLRGC